MTKRDERGRKELIKAFGNGCQLCTNGGTDGRHRLRPCLPAGGSGSPKKDQLCGGWGGR